MHGGRTVNPSAGGELPDLPAIIGGEGVNRVRVGCGHEDFSVHRDRLRQPAAERRGPLWFHGIGNRPGRRTAAARIVPVHRPVAGLRRRGRQGLAIARSLFEHGLVWERHLAGLVALRRRGEETRDFEGEETRTRVGRRVEQAVGRHDPVLTRAANPTVVAQPALVETQHFDAGLAGEDEPFGRFVPVATVMRHADLGALRVDLFRERAGLQVQSLEVRPDPDHAVDDEQISR